MTNPSPDTSAAEVVALAEKLRTTKAELAAAIRHEKFRNVDSDVWWRAEGLLGAAAYQIETSRAETAAANARADALRSALVAVVNSPALSGVRTMVAGWNGEDRDGGPYERHPSQLGAHISTNCGRIYALDESLVTARALLAEIEGKSK